MNMMILKNVLLFLDIDNKLSTIEVASAKTGSIISEFNRMIKEYERGSIDIVLTKSLSRFGRDARESLEAVSRIRVVRTRIIFEKDKIDIETVKDEFLISIIEGCEQAENDWRNENIRLDLKYRSEDEISGLYNRGCFGYKKDKNGIISSRTN